MVVLGILLTIYGFTKQFSLEIVYSILGTSVSTFVVAGKLVSSSVAVEQFGEIIMGTTVRTHSELNKPGAIVENSLNMKQEVDFSE